MENVGQLPRLDWDRYEQMVNQAETVVARVVGLCNWDEWAQTVGWIRGEGSSTDGLVAVTSVFEKAGYWAFRGASVVKGWGQYVGLAGAKQVILIGGGVGLGYGALEGMKAAGTYVRGQKAYSDWTKQKEQAAVDLELSSFLAYVRIELSDSRFRCAVHPEKVMNEVWRTPGFSGFPQGRMVDSESMKQATVENRVSLLGHVFQVNDMRICPVETMEIYDRLVDLLDSEVELGLCKTTILRLEEIREGWCGQRRYYQDLVA